VDTGKEQEKKKGFRFTLRVKMNLLIAAGILITSICLLMVSYRTHSRQTDQQYYEEALRAARSMANLMNPEEVDWFRREIQTDDFREARERAAAAGDPAVIEDWLKSRPGFDRDGNPAETLLDDYENFCNIIGNVREAFPLTRLYLEEERDSGFYVLADPEQGLLRIGAEDPDAGYDDEGASGMQPDESGWLCFTYEFISLPTEKENREIIIAYAFADINMNHVMEQRRSFLSNSILLIVLLTAAAIVIGMLVVRRIAVKPLRLLRQGTLDFAEKKAGETGDTIYTMDDVMNLKIPNRDEIGDLYQGIREMQASIVHNTEELARNAAERERARTELDLAAKIQVSALPKADPDFTGHPAFDLSASMTPAKEIGGDFYDFFDMDDGRRLALVIADVSGKGIPAALFMMTAKDRINSRAQAGGTPAEILSDVNRQLCVNNRARMFVTVWLGILDLETGILTASNGGHEEPILRNGDRFELVHDHHSLVLGTMKRATYSDYEIRMKPGDVIFVYTDGVPDAKDETQRYGTQRLLEALNVSAPADPKAILSTVTESIAAFTGGAEQFDDLTMLCVRWKGNLLG
jgi:sigma-B regulation protein RsbU (phosphoserine phosphatase)